ncbi:hypothetical protein HYX07_05275 [Candidatus Woesearchaeota archaeon]|nr:hypothetical protein [Candidatus Woesearchaeota archaeon]
MVLHGDFEKALICYGLKLESYCLIDVYSILENKLIIKLNDEIKEFKISNRLKRYLRNRAHWSDMEFFLRRLKASTIANILKQIGILGKENYKYISKLEDLRDALVHRNLSQLEGFNINFGRVHMHTTDYGTKFDTEKYLLGAVSFSWNMLSKKERIESMKHFRRTWEKAS